MNQIGPIPLLGVALAAVCVLIVGLGAVLRQLYARRHLKHLRAEYEAKKCMRPETERR